MAYYVQTCGLQGPFTTAEEAELERQKHKRKYEIYLQQTKTPGCSQCEIQIKLCDSCNEVLYPKAKKKKKKDTATSSPATKTTEST